MSAFVCSDLHINVLASWAAAHAVSVWHEDRRFECAEDPAAVAGILYEANVKSVNHRYNKRQPTNNFKFVSVPMEDKWTPVVILKQCDCYDYQACELPNYKTSLAYAIVDAIRGKAIEKLPGYDAAPWKLD